jgi:hypothetical protein
MKDVIQKERRKWEGIEEELQEVRGRKRRVIIGQTP